MKQSRLMSLAESLVNVVVGYGVAVVAQALIFPLFNINASLSDNLLIGAAFSVVSIVRSFILRRAFERLRPRHKVDPESARVISRVWFGIGRSV